MDTPASGKTGTPPSMQKRHGKIFTKDKDKAEVLNIFLCSALNDEPPIDQFTQSSQPENPTYILRDIIISAEDIQKRPDAISINVIKNCPNLDLPFQIHFNHSIQTSTMQQDRKDANISPIHKKGSLSKSSKYRPVSITSQVVKLMERILYQHLLDLTTKNRTISCHQHGLQNQ